MKVKVTITTDDEYRQYYDVDVDGKRVFAVSDDEPEDNTLGRNFYDVHKLPDLMQMAYEAGRRGEEFIIEVDHRDTPVIFQ